MYFKHDGNGLKSIVKNSNLKLERDAIYKQIYGFNLYKRSKFLRKESDLKVSHVALNKVESQEVLTKDDIKFLNII